MEKHKEIGYQLGDIYWRNLEGFQELWNKTDAKTKDNCVNKIGKLALKLCKEAESCKCNTDKNTTCSCGGSCGCGDKKPKKYNEIVNKQLGEVIVKREQHIDQLLNENWKLTKRKNLYKNLLIFSVLLGIVVIIYISQL